LPSIHFILSYQFFIIPQFMPELDLLLLVLGVLPPVLFLFQGDQLRLRIHVRRRVVSQGGFELQKELGQLAQAHRRRRRGFNIESIRGLHQLIAVRKFLQHR
jgi:hypothetical protein